jgi:hypothetical protein
VRPKPRKNIFILSSDEEDNRPDQGTEELRLNKKLQQLHQRTSDFV